MLASLAIPMGSQAVIATDDQDMVNKIAGDPYGIGYCSSAIADPNKVQILGIATSTSTANFYPQTNPKYRWLVPSSTSGITLNNGLTFTSGSGFIRTLYCVANGNAASVSDSTRFADSMLAPGSSFVTTSLQAGPLFQASYLPN